MNIPVTQLLLKMNDHIQKATNGEDTIREHITAIRTLCDLILDQNHSEMKSTPPQIQVIHPMVKKSPSIQNDANGDSIFDF